MLRLLTSLLLTGVITASGCNQKTEYPMPETFPVTGSVTVAGGKPPVGTLVVFEPESLDLKAQGIVDENGRFSVYMIYRGERLVGATPGSHRVAIVTPIGTDRGGGDRIMLEQRYVIEPKPNDFALSVK